MQKYNLIIQKFGSKAEKSGWTYIEIEEQMAQNINPGIKTTYQVKGKLDQIPIKAMSLLPMGNGNFIIPLNLEMRKKLNKKVGESILVELDLDETGYQLNSDFLEFLKTEPKAHTYFNSLTSSHQKYFSKWIDTAKSSITKADRIAESVTALQRHWSYSQMIRNRKNNN
ncbi:MAG: DUF1905 domain-containing protein [Saprospiraceae bacterium]|nr:DUF1905 domain-containing protein [Saprospiraceae bacterium]MBK9630202.1 DUF1905 domain-containing protein [Saprospiraceae bacterium]